jgi:hypothetical protein
MEVMKEPCGTCPHVSPLTAESQTYYLKWIVEMRSQHFCHMVDNKKLCRGGRDIMLKVMCAMKIIDKPTDAAFNAARKKYER